LIQSILYGRYGRERAAICATVIHYRPRMATEVGTAWPQGMTRLAVLILARATARSPQAYCRSRARPRNPESARRSARAASCWASRVICRSTGRPCAHPRAAMRPCRSQRRHGGSHLPSSGKRTTSTRWAHAEGGCVGARNAHGIRKSFELSAPLRALTPPPCPLEIRRSTRILCRADFIGVFRGRVRAQMSSCPRLKPGPASTICHRGGDRAPRGPSRGRHGATPTCAGRDAASRGLSLQALEAVLRQTLGVPAVPGRQAMARSPSSAPDSRPTRPQLRAPWPPSAMSAHPHLPRKLSPHGRQRYAAEFGRGCSPARSRAS